MWKLVSNDESLQLASSLRVGDESFWRGETVDIDGRLHAEDGEEMVEGEKEERELCDLATFLVSLSHEVHHAPYLMRYI